MHKILILISLFSLFTCSSNKRESSALMVALGQSSFNDSGPLIIPLVGDVDTNITTTCGTASSSSTTSSSSSSSTTTASSKKTISSTLSFRTREKLTLKFTYDPSKTKGSIDATQGFIYDKGELTKITSPNLGSITGTEGFVDWTNGSVYVANSNVNILEVAVSLIGRAKRTSAVTTTTCNTSDGTNCTSANTNGRTCLTTDNKVCLVSSSNPTDRQVYIRGLIKCYIN